MRNFDRGFTIFGFFFAFVFIVILGGIAVTAYLGYQCYSSNDPNSMACFMTSNRQEIGIRIK